MRIEPTTIQNGSIAVQPVKKRHKKEKEEKPPEYSESLILSEATQLLNKLLNATSNQFSPYPFYFRNAAERNTKQASALAKNIQNQAKSLGVLLNYTMIYEMVVNLASKGNHILWVLSLSTTITRENETLSVDEKALFERLHNACQQNQISTDVITSTALNLIQFKQTRITTATNTPAHQTEYAKFIVEHLKKSSELNNNNVRKALSTIIKQYVTQAKQAETH